jgi:hypothetical protein
MTLKNERVAEQQTRGDNPECEGIESFRARLDRQDKTNGGGRAADDKPRSSFAGEHPDLAPFLLVVEKGGFY